MSAKAFLGRSVWCMSAWLFGSAGLTSKAVATPILWIDDVAGNIGTVDIATGTVNVIGSAGVVLTDIAFDPDGELWGISFTNLYRLSKVTGAAALVGTTGIPMGNALVFDTSGTLYAAGASENELFTVDTTTGAGTSIGTVGSRSAGDLAFNGGDLYMSNRNDRLVKIALAPTVSGTAIGPFGFSDVYGMATGDNGVLYGASGTDVFSVDVSTGQGTLVINYAGHGLLGANGTAFVNEAPEPSSLALLILAGMFSCRRQRR